MSDAEQVIQERAGKPWVFFVRPITSFHNVGDLLICRALLENLSRFGVVYVDSRCCPESFLEKLTGGLEGGVRQTSNFYQRVCAERFAGKRVGLVTIPGHFFGRGIKKFLSTMLAGCILALMRCFGIRIYKFGGCLGPLSRSVLFAERFRRIWFSYYGIRDSVSINCIGDRKNTQLFPDLAFVADELDLEPLESDGSQYCVVSFRAETNAELKNSDYRDSLKRRLCDVVQKLQCDLRFVFCHQVPSDADFVRELYQAVSGLGVQCELQDKILTLADAVSLYRSARCVFSNRLHVLLPCMALGVRHLAILDVKQHHKIAAIYRDNGLDSLLCDVNGVTCYDDMFWATDPSLLKNVADKNREKAERIFAEVLG